MTQAWLIGALINSVGSVMINLGTNVMKLGHNKRAAMEHRIGKNVPIRIFREWQMGVFLFIVGNLANFISFGYAAQSLLSALGSIQFVSNVAFASLVLKEKVTKMILCATGCIVTGCVMLVLFGSHASRQFTVDEMMHLYMASTYTAYLMFLGTSVVIMYCIYKCGKKKMLSVGMTGLNHYWYRLLPVSYAMFSGMIGTQSVLFSKTLSTLLRVTLGGNSQMKSWFTWVIIVLFLITSTFWITRLNKGLKFFPAMIIVPTMQISWTFFSIISGMLYFQEYHDFTLINGVMFTVAVMIVFFGVFLLTKTRVIEHQLSSHLSGSLEDEKMRDQTTDSDRSNSSRIAVGQFVKARDIARDDDVRSPIAKLDHLDDESTRDVPTEKLNSNNFGELLKSRIAPNTPSSQLIGKSDDDGDLECQPQPPQTESVECVTKSLFGNVTEDFSIDVWSSVKGTVGVGCEAAPGVTLFGPPGVGWERGSSVRGSMSCCTAVAKFSDVKVDGDVLPIVHLPIEASTSSL